MCGVARKHRIKNIFICKQLGIILIEDKMRENRLRWYEHVLMRPTNMIVRKDKMILIETKKRMIQKFLIETINKDLNLLNLIKHMAFYRSQWQQKIHVVDLNCNTSISLTSEVGKTKD